MSGRLGLSSRLAGALLLRGGRRGANHLVCAVVPPSCAEISTRITQQGNLDLCRRIHISSLQGCKNPGALSKEEEEEMVPERLYSRVVIKVKGADFRVLDSYCRYVITAAKALGINIGKKVALPMKIQKFTVLKSVHIYKKHRVQYEIRTHMRMMQIWEITGTTADVFLEYIQRNLPEGVSMTVSQEKMDTLPALLTSPPEGEAAKADTSKSTKKGKK